MFRQTDLLLETILYDEGILTEMRTAAASAVASTMFLDKSRVSEPDFLVGLVGCGVQGIWQLRFLQRVFAGLADRCTLKVLVRSRSTASALAFKEQMRSSAFVSDRLWDIVVLSEEMNFSDCDLIHTVTGSRTPVLSLLDVNMQRNLHITAVGADSPGKQELALDLVAAADMLVCDSRTQARERGELQHYLRENADTTRIVELGELKQEKLAFSTRRLSIFDTSGIAIQDVYAAKAVCAALR